MFNLELPTGDKAIAGMAEQLKQLSDKLDRIEVLLLGATKTVLTLDDCIRYTGYSRQHIYKMTSCNEIPYYKPNGGVIFFDKAEIDQWLLRNRQSTSEEIERKAATYCRTRGAGRRK